MRRTIDPGVTRVIERTVKHRYLYPLNHSTRRQVTALAKPYPEREPAE
ncbi:hypothetical protein ACFQ68_36425 [Amycolatopsis japonica]